MVFPLMGDLVALAGLDRSQKTEGESDGKGDHQV
jgi:hypothetical protein